MSREGGISRYTHTTADIYFPFDKVCCALCPLMETYARKQCRLTGEYIVDDRLIGFRCPLTFDEEGPGDATEPCP